MRYKKQIVRALPIAGRFVQIICLCVMAAISYGIVHDQITARLCLEYFTLTRPPLISTHDPAAVGLFWGIFSTWWVGIPFGGGLAAACCLRPLPTRPDAIVLPLARLLAMVALCAILGGLAGYIGCRTGWLHVSEEFVDCVPLKDHALFLADALADLAGAIAAFLGGIILILIAASGHYSDGKPAFTVN